MKYDLTLHVLDSSPIQIDVAGGIHSGYSSGSNVDNWLNNIRRWVLAQQQS